MVHASEFASLLMGSNAVPDSVVALLLPHLDVLHDKYDLLPARIVSTHSYSSSSRNSELVHLLAALICTRACMCMCLCSRSSELVHLLAALICTCIISFWFV